MFGRIDFNMKMFHELAAKFELLPEREVPAIIMLITDDINIFLSIFLMLFLFPFYFTLS